MNHFSQNPHWDSIFQLKIQLFTCILFERRFNKITEKKQIISLIDQLVALIQNTTRIRGKKGYLVFDLGVFGFK